MIKKMLSSLAVVLLSGCVYYVPYEVAVTEPGLDEAVGYEAPDVVYASYVVSPYYPWGSVDYFYLGNHYYRPYSGISFSYGFYGGGGWYPRYYNPYYYSAWYQPFYGYPYSYYGPYYGAGYGWGYANWNYYYPRHRGGHDGGYDDGHGGGHHGGGNEGNGNTPVAGRGGMNSGGDFRNGIDESIRNREIRSLDRDGNARRQAAPIDRNVSVAPSSDGSDRGMVVISRGDNKVNPSRVQPSRVQPSRVQPGGNSGSQGKPGSVEPVDLSGFSDQNGQVRMIQPERNKAAPSRTGMPAGYSRPVPADVPNGMQVTERQAPTAPVRLPRAEAAPSAPRYMSPPPMPAEPQVEYSQGPAGEQDRGEPRRDDDGGSLRRRDRDQD